MDMHAGKTSSGFRPTTAILYAAAIALPVILLGASGSVAPRQAQATPAYATQTGLGCGQCHTSPAGGPTTAFGKAFAANGHKVPSKKK